MYVLSYDTRHPSGYWVGRAVLCVAAGALGVYLWGTEFEDAKKNE